MPVGLTDCDECGDKIPYPPKNVVDKYNGEELCDECRMKKYPEKASEDKSGGSGEIPMSLGVDNDEE